MSFERKTWIDRQAEFPTRRKLNPTGTADVYDVSRDEGLILEEGDPFNAATMNALEGRIEAALNDTILPATCTYSSGIFTLSGLPETLPEIFTVRFKVPADFMEGDTLSINAMPYALFMPNQQPASAGAFAQNAVVSLNVDLATGKAFLAGGGGSVGEWETVEIDGLTPPLSNVVFDHSIKYNKTLEKLSVQLHIRNETNTYRDSIGLITSYFKGSADCLLTGMVWSNRPGDDRANGMAVLQIEDGNMQIYFDALSPTTGSSKTISNFSITMGGVCYLSASHIS